MGRLARAFIITGWLIPIVVLGWFKFVSGPRDSEDSGWALIALYSVGAAFVAGWILLLLGTIGVTRASVKEAFDRVLIGFGATGFCLYTLVLLVGAFLFAPT